jgi:hypothetical protein
MGDIMKRTMHEFHPTRFDFLEKREVLSNLVLQVAHLVPPVHPAAAIVAPVHVTTPAVMSVTRTGADVTTTAMKSMGQPLTNIYLASVNGASAATLAASFPLVLFQGNLVGVSIHARTSATTLAAELTSLGATIRTTSTAYLTVEAYVPVSQLLAVAQLDQTLAGSPLYKPMLFGVGRFGGLAR